MGCSRSLLRLFCTKSVWISVFLGMGNPLRVPSPRELRNPHIIPSFRNRGSNLVPGYQEPNNPHIIPGSWVFRSWKSKTHMGPGFSEMEPETDTPKCYPLYLSVYPYPQLRDTHIDDYMS